MTAYSTVNVYSTANDCQNILHQLTAYWSSYSIVIILQQLAACFAVYNYTVKPLNNGRILLNFCGHY